MSPRNTELPDGTDHIVNGALETRPRPTGSVGTIGQTDNAFIAGETPGAAVPVRQQLRDSAGNLKNQAGGKIREIAVDGKGRATDALDELSRAVSESAVTIDEKLGEQYGQYARQAADAVSGFADTLRSKDVDELYDDAANVVRKSPVVAIGVAAALGFALVRVVKSGLDRPVEPGAAPRTDI